MLLVATLALLLPSAAWAQTVPVESFPALSGRVVDAANILPADEKARLETKLAALETQSRRQLVVATVPDLQGYDIEDYGYQLGRHWGLGDKGRNDGAILLIAPKERRMRIEVGYGLEGTLTDGLSALIIQQQIVPKFKAGDLPGGIEAGADALIHQLTLPPDQARQIAAAAKPQGAEGGDMPFSTVVWLVFFVVFLILRMLRRMAGGGQRYRSSGLGPIMLWSALGGMGGSGRGGGGWGGGGGGFSGGGGSFGGGGSSGSW
jgi:uncharacterized protein